MLNKLFEGKKQTAIIGTVISKPSQGKYIVEDAQGRQYQASSTVRYTVGSSVIVLDGFILGKGGTRPEPQIFKV